MPATPSSWIMDAAIFKKLNYSISLTNLIEIGDQFSLENQKRQLLSHLWYYSAQILLRSLKFCLHKNDKNMV